MAALTELKSVRSPSMISRPGAARAAERSSILCTSARTGIFNSSNFAMALFPVGPVAPVIRIFSMSLCFCISVSYRATLKGLSDKGLQGVV